MQLGQSLKMAFKSLWSNKLRSFLTMLGIIIGVMTVAVLTSVASGVSTAVVSQIRSQSTLAVVMATSENTTYSKLGNALRDNKPASKEDEYYYEYSLLRSDTSVVANEEIYDGYSDSDIKALLKTEKLYTDEELDKFIGTPFEDYIDLYRYKNPAPISTTINMVDDNFLKVFELSFTGKFPEKDDEVVVDETFVKTNFGEDASLKSVIGNKITIGVQVYECIIVRFNSDVSTSTKEAVCEAIAPTSQSSQNMLGVKIIKNDDDSLYVDYTENSIKINISFNKYLTLDDFSNSLKTLLSANTEIQPYLDSNSPVSVQEVYDAGSAKVFTITGAISSEDANLFGSSTTSSSSGESKPSISLSGKTVKGNIYMSMTQNNFACLNLNYSGLEDLPISMAYLRYKTEDVISASTSKIMVNIVKNTGLVFGEDFMMVSMESVSKIIDNVMGVLTTMLTVISIVSLVVGGIGIMNIMLVAVTERTREIGVRKAIGAKRSSILLQFLVEALLLAIIGGLIGLGLSAIACAVIGHFMGITITMPLWVIGMSIGFCSLIGLVFGMFPAVKASKMQPIDALRRE